MLPDDLFARWFESKSPQAVIVRQDIIKRLYTCANKNFTSDLEYLSNKDVLLESISRRGFKLTTAEGFTE